MLRFVVYQRVSSHGQVDAWGFDIQTEACQSYAGTRGVVVEVIRDEGVSGTKPAVERPGLMRALAMLRDGDADAMLVARLDRVARDLTTQEAILAEVWSLGSAVHTCDMGEVQRDDPDDPTRTAIRQVMGAFAQLDRALVVKRLRDGRKAKAAQGGKAVGRYPFGWSREGEVEREQAVLSTMKTLLSQGYTLDAITADLNTRPHHHPRHAEKWSRQTVSSIIQRAGLRR